MRPKQITVPVLTNDLNGICLDQTTSGADDLTLNGALVSAVTGVATAAAAQIVSIEGTGNSAGVTFTITGTNADGHTQTEGIAGPNSSTVISTYHFITVTGIAASGAVDGNVEIGWMATDGMSTKTIPVDYKDDSIGLAFNLTAGTMTASAQYSSDDPFDHSRSTTFQQEAYWVEVTNLSGVTADAATSVLFPIRAVRFIQSVGSTTGENTFTLLQGRNC
jgi:hypothetical protein